jgi:hypothetical protein
MRRVRSRSLLQPVFRLSMGPVCLAGVVAALGFAAAPAVAQDCPNAAIRAQQGPLVEALPDCMALEQVSPTKKFSQDAYPESVSADGLRATYVTQGDAVNDPPIQQGIIGDLYVASRSGSGWVGETTLPSPGKAGAITNGWNDSKLISLSFSPDFSRWVTFGTASDRRYSGVGTVWRGGVGDVYEPLSPLLSSLTGNNSPSGTRLLGVSADHGRVVFRASALNTTYLAGDPVASGVGAEPNAYVVERDGAGVPSVSLLARDGSGTVWGGRCGVRLPRRQGFAQNGGQGAVSLDGSRVYFTTRPSQTGSAACNTTANRLRIMRRVETSGGPQVSELFASECDRVAPACNVADGDDLYQGASVDGTKVYFTTTRQLADSDLDAGLATPCGTFFGAPGCDLYLYDSQRPVGDRLVQVSAGDAGSPTPGAGAGVLDGVAAISSDGSHVYFVAQGVLTDDPNLRGQTAAEFQRNLYSFVYDEDHPNGDIQFVAQVAALDGGSTGGLWGSPGAFVDRSYPVPAASGTAGEVDPVGGDGHILVFSSAAALTADDTDGGREDVFRYDSDTGEMTRMSRAAPGGSDNGPFNVGPRIQNMPDRVGTGFAEFNRVASEDGDTVLFTTAERLVSEDDNTTSETYMWRDSEIYRLPQTAGVASGTAISPAALSHDGSVVLFGSRSQLLPQDGDSAIDSYVARVDGGYEAPEPPDPCEVMTGGCQGGGTDPLGSDKWTSSGGGNAAPGARKTLAVSPLGRQARRRAARTGRLTLSVRSNGTGTVKVVGRARVGKLTVRVGEGTTTLGETGTARVGLRLSARAKRALRNGTSLRVALKVTSPGARSRAMSVLLPGVQS